MKMKVLILTEGGRNIGFGHISRCGNLYRAFAENGHDPQFIINGDQSVAELLTDKNHQLFDWREDEEKLFSLIQEMQVDVIIIDSYLASTDFFKNISETVKVPVYLDDNKRMDYPPGIVLNWSIYAHDLNYPENGNITYLLGTEYLTLREAFAVVPHKEIKETPESIMVTMGGDDSRNLTPTILKVLKECHPRLKKNVIIGKAFENIEEIHENADENVNLIHYPDAEGMKSIMLESDLAVTSGGQTIYEMARVGLPAIAVATAGNQLNNVDTWDKLGFVSYAGFWSSAALRNNLRKHLRDFMLEETRMQSSQAGRSRVTGNGEQKIVSAVIERLKENQSF